MGIKWDDVRVAVTALGNRIVIGKVDPKLRGVLKDKSGDRTDEVVGAVCQYLDGWCTFNEQPAVQITTEIGTLVFTKKVEEPKDA